MKFKFTKAQNGGYLNNKKITPKKSLVIGVLVGGIVFGSIGVAAATYFSASQISFTPLDSTWNVTNVEEAVNNLYENSKSGYNSVVQTVPSLSLENKNEKTETVTITTEKAATIVIGSSFCPSSYTISKNGTTVDSGTISFTEKNDQTVYYYSTILNDLKEGDSITVTTTKQSCSYTGNRMILITTLK